MIYEKLIEVWRFGSIFLAREENTTMPMFCITKTLPCPCFWQKDRGKLQIHVFNRVCHLGMTVDGISGLNSSGALKHVFNRVLRGEEAWLDTVVGMFCYACGCALMRCNESPATIEIPEVCFGKKYKKREGKEPGVRSLFSEQSIFGGALVLRGLESSKYFERRRICSQGD